MRVFGYSWKMHFLEMLFSPNVFMVWIDFRFYFTFKYHFPKNREREGVCEWDRAGAQRERERERERGHCRRPTSFGFAGDPETSRHEPRSSFDFAIQLWLRIAPIDFAGERRGQDRRSTSSSNCTLWLRRRTQRPGSSFDFDFAGTDRTEFAIEK